MAPSRTLLVALGLFALVSCVESRGLPTAPDNSGLGPGLNSSNGGSGGSGSTTRTVSVGDDFFAPDTLTVDVRDTVTWRWTGLNPHSVTFSDGTSSGVKTTGTFQRFFGAAGTYPFFSTLPADSLMRGTVIVR